MGRGWRSVWARSSSACWETSTRRCAPMPRGRDQRGPETQSRVGWMILAVLAMTCVPARGADAPADAPAETPRSFLDATDLGKSKEPIVVTSDRLEYDYRGNVVVYRGGVQATQGRLKITSDTLTVTFADADPKTDPKSDTKADGKDGAAPPAQGGLAL